MPSRDAAKRREHAAAERQKILDWAKANSRKVYEFGTNHMKCGDINFYPSSGTIFRDGNPREAETGADHFISMLTRGKKGFTINLALP